ncbi:MAG: NAD-dependent epimerase/dehydratase family protein [Pseudomonadota bacterium]
MNPSRLKVLITGANGFVGASLMQCFTAAGHDVVGSVRRRVPSAARHIHVGDLDEYTQWQHALVDVDVVVHAAARVHVMNARQEDANEFQRVNVDGTLNLAQQAMASGCRRFVFISSIKVNGERTHDVPFSAGDTPRPCDVYAQSKYDAECALTSALQDSDMELVIVRPPLVYGSGVKANLQQLIHAVTRGIPLPLGRAHKRRSLVGLDNLCDFIRVCATHPNAANNVFLVSDGYDVSSRDLVALIASALSTTPRVFSLPYAVLKLGARCLKQEARVSKLFDALQVNIDKNKQLLSWTPPYTVQQQIHTMVHGTASEERAL